MLDKPKVLQNLIAKENLKVLRDVWPKYTPKCDARPLASRLEPKPNYLETTLYIPNPISRLEP